MTHLPPWGVPPPWSPRPPSVSWPPCPPWPPPRPVLSPPDIAQALKLLQQMFASTEAFQALVKQAVEQILVADPTWLAGATPTVGVTDGVDAQPGMVGEYVHWKLAVPFTTTPNDTTVVNFGTLPAGDWDCWAWGGVDVFVATAEYQLMPVGTGPPGFSSAMQAYQGETTPGGGISVVMSSVTARALTSGPTPVVMQTVVNSATAGHLNIEFIARRRR